MNLEISQKRLHVQMIPNFAWASRGHMWASRGPRVGMRGHAWARVGTRGHAWAFEGHPLKNNETVSLLVTFFYCKYSNEYFP